MRHRLSRSCGLQSAVRDHSGWRAARSRRLSARMHVSGLYLDLMKRVLTRSDFPDGTIEPWTRGVRELRAQNWVRHILVPTQRLLGRRGYRLVEAAETEKPIDTEQIREVGADWPATAETMIGLRRLDNLQR